METEADRNSDVSGPGPEQSADPGSDLTLGSPETGAALGPAPPAAGPAPSDPAADTWVTSQLLAPPTAACRNQLIIVEQRGQTRPGERVARVIVAGQSESREVLVIPSNQLSGSQLAVFSSSPAGAVVNVPVTTVTDSSSSSSRRPSEQAAGVRLDVPARVKPPPCGAPCWALRLRHAQKLGDSYRGFCCSEAELEAILLLHKQQTGCVFGTRQSPSADKPATRLMWKSQYVPYDGVPFVNAGSRAVVMECQFGPRRRGLQPNRSSEHAAYKATCPARIYIKKVRKFPEFGVPTEPTADRKTVRRQQEKAFQSLRGRDLESGGAIRFYLQLPTERAHLYHTVDTPPVPPPPPDLPPPPTQPEEAEQEAEQEEQEAEQEEQEEEQEAEQQEGVVPSRLHPRVAERIRQLVAAGHHQVYSVRKQLRRFVEEQLSRSDGPPERHNLRLFPTVNDIKNHIHESQKALGLTPTAEWTDESGDPLMETFTLTPAAEDVDGSDSLSPEAVQLFASLSSLQPKIFAQLQGILQPLPPPSFLQTPGGESAGASGPEQVLDEGQRLCEGTQLVVLQHRENVPLQNISSPARTLVDVNMLQVEVKEEEEEMKMKTKELEDSTGSC